MHRLLPFIALGLLPVTALALDLTDRTSRYTDAPFGKAEAVSISLLTSIDVVQGNPDGTFAPRRTLNRAEFLKIVLKTHGDGVGVSDASACFPDVPADAWFAQYVCYAKAKQIVGGYPDGRFRPENPVNYAEALKILTVLYGYDVAQAGSGQQWYEVYAAAAQARKTSLPVALGYDEPLTRGLMARLAAAFYAEAEGELDAFRMAEQGRSSRSSVATSSAASSASSVSSVSSASSASSVSSSSSSSAAAASGLYPAVSRLLIVGTQTPVLMDGLFASPDEDALIRFADIRLFREIRSLSGLTLIDATGQEIGRLKLRGDDPTYKLWRGEFASGAYLLKKGVSVRLGIRASLKDDGSTSGELFETAEFTLLAQGQTTGLSKHLLPTDHHFPMHQTTLSKLTQVRNAHWPTGELKAGKRVMVGSFSFSGSVKSNGNLKVTEVNLLVDSKNVTLSDWRIGGEAEVQQADCGIDLQQPNRVSCSYIPEAVQPVTAVPRILSVFADVSLVQGATEGSLKLSLQESGGIGTNGAVRWSDGSGFFNWIEGSSPLAVGTAWTVR